jgi:hypothetical protein
MRPSRPCGSIGRAHSSPAHTPSSRAHWDWTLGLQGGKEAVTVGMPFVTILRLDAGLVLEHRDFADYQPFIVAQRKATTGE